LTWPPGRAAVAAGQAGDVLHDFGTGPAGPRRRPAQDRNRPFRIAERAQIRDDQPIGDCAGQRDAAIAHGRHRDRQVAPRRRIAEPGSGDREHPASVRHRLAAQQRAHDLDRLAHRR
jgi:hypothetical protein